jgi:tetratricopeptide (TPR) repeat protein
MKADLIILDLIANNNWKRPIYFAVTVGNDSYMNLEPFFQLEGLAYRLVPIQNPPDQQGQTGRVASDIMYDNMMNKFLFGNMNREDVYLDQNNLNMAMNFRNNYSRLAEALIAEGSRDSALKVLDYMNEMMPDKTVPYNVMMLRPIELYYSAANPTPGMMQDSTINSSTVELPEQRRRQAIEKANAITLRMADIYENELEYYYSLKGTEYLKYIDRDMNQALAIFNELIRMAKANGQDEIVKQLEPRFKKLEDRYGGAR